MQQHLELFKDNAQLPKEADVVIVGGGIIGVAASLFLAERGLKVAVVEKGVVGGEQSSRNWGWCRTAERDLRELPLMLESMRLWRFLNERVQGETGYRECGIVTLSSNDEDLAKKQEWVDQSRNFGAEARMLSPSQCRSLVPLSAKQWKGGIYTPTDGRAEPGLAAPLLARAAVARGATITSHCAANRIEKAGGAVCGVNTSKGFIATKTVIIAGGMWSSRILRGLGIRFPQLGVLASVLQTAPIPGGPDISVSGNGFSFRRRLDGGYTVSNGAQGIAAPLSLDSFRYFRDFLPVLREEWREVSFVRLRQEGVDRLEHSPAASEFERTPVLNPRPRHRDICNAKENLSRWFPSFFADRKIVAQWAGVVDVTPDSLPVISPISSVPGLILASGFSGHGFGLGPGAGALAASIATGSEGNEAAAFRFERFERRNSTL